MNNQRTQDEIDLIEEHGDVAEWFLEEHRADEWDGLLVMVCDQSDCHRDSWAEEIIIEQGWLSPSRRRIDVDVGWVCSDMEEWYDYNEAADYLFADDGPVIVKKSSDGSFYLFWRK